MPPFPPMEFAHVIMFASGAFTGFVIGLTVKVRNAS